MKLSLREARTLFLGVPDEDWYAVKRGFKSEFRLAGRPITWAVIHQVPTPVVAYSRNGKHRQLMVLEKVWREELRAISEESLQREGFESFAHFRRYWMIREGCLFRPLQRVWCFSVRPWTPDDVTTTGRVLIEHLYGEHMT